MPEPRQRRHGISHVSNSARHGAPAVSFDTVFSPRSVPAERPVETSRMPRVSVVVPLYNKGPLPAPRPLFAGQADISGFRGHRGQRWLNRSWRRTGRTIRRRARPPDQPGERRTRSGTQSRHRRSERRAHGIPRCRRRVVARVSTDCRRCLRQERATCMLHARISGSSLRAVDRTDVAKVRT